MIFIIHINDNTKKPTDLRHLVSPRCCQFNYMPRRVQAQVSPWLLNLTEGGGKPPGIPCDQDACCQWPFSTGTTALSGRGGSRPVPPLRGRGGPRTCGGQLHGRPLGLVMPGLWWVLSTGGSPFLKKRRCPGQGTASGQILVRGSTHLRHTAFPALGGRERPLSTGSSQRWRSFRTRGGGGKRSLTGT